MRGKMYAALGIGGERNGGGHRAILAQREQVLWCACGPTSTGVHGVVFGLGHDSKDVVRAGVTSGDNLILDMEDLLTFDATTANCKHLMQTFWVLTHELLVHFFLKLDHGLGYLPTDPTTYNYDNDPTLKTMTKWSIELGLPDRVRHPPKVTANKRTYIYLDPFPEIDFTSPLSIIGEEREKLFKELRLALGNLDEVPATAQNVKSYPFGWFVDDDSDNTGHDIKGRISGHGRWKFSSKIH